MVCLIRELGANQRSFAGEKRKERTSGQKVDKRESHVTEFIQGNPLKDLQKL